MAAAKLTLDLMDSSKLEVRDKWINAYRYVKFSSQAAGCMYNISLSLTAFAICLPLPVLFELPQHSTSTVRTGSLFAFCFKNFAYVFIGNGKGTGRVSSEARFSSCFAKLEKFRETLHKFCLLSFFAKSKKHAKIGTLGTGDLSL
jgi:hypothetical protein